MTEIPSFMRLMGDEDCGVSLSCYHSDCDPYHHGDRAYYGGIGVPTVSMPFFADDRLGDFVDFIRQHAESHREPS